MDKQLRLEDGVEHRELSRANVISVNGVYKKNPWPVLKCHVNIFQLTVKSIDWLEGKNVFFVDKTSL